MSVYFIKVSKRNLEAAKDECTPTDIADELVPGCKLWERSTADDTRATLCEWPNGRGAVFLGGDSLWGDWRGKQLITDCGRFFDESGDEIIEEDA